MQDRPTARELLAAVREFLHQEIEPTFHDRRQKFRTLIAENVLRIVERELASEEKDLRAEWRRLVALEGTPSDQTEPPGTLDTLREDIVARKQALCSRIREGEADAGPWRREVLDYTTWAVEEKVRIANPQYLERTGGS